MKVVEDTWSLDHKFGFEKGVKLSLDKNQNLPGFLDFKIQIDGD